MRPQPIQTVYRGYRFRSRLEARWAVFFDALGLAFQYEPEGFDLGGVWYLPDFYLPDIRCWVEVKGQEPSKHERFLIDLLNQQMDDAAVILWTPVGSPSPNPYEWSVVQCLSCLTLSVWDLKTGADGDMHCCEAPQWSRTSEQLMQAYTAARQARFEFGEKG